MSIAKFTPAVTETKTVEVAPAKITLELTTREAQALLAVIGAATRGKTLMPLYTGLKATFTVNSIPRLYLSQSERSIRGVNEDELFDASGVRA